MERFTLAKEASEPFKKFANAQEYFDSLSMSDFKKWEEDLSSELPPPQLIIIALSLYQNEVGGDVSFTEAEAQEVSESFRFYISLANLVRDGSMTQQGTILLHSENCTFQMTEKGKSHVENMLKKK